MISEILIIRTKQTSRIFIQIGIFRVLFVFGLVAFGILLLFSQFAKETYREVIIGFFAFAILSFHLKRNDKEFLKYYAASPRNIFFVEYLLISTPLIIILIYFALWNYIILYLLLLVSIATINITLTKISINSVFQKIIPDDNFEWKSGIRKSLVFIISIWIIGFTTSFFTAIVPIVIFFLGAIILSFYKKPEPLQILLANELSSKKFLIKKISCHSLAFFVLIAPLIISFSVFNHEYYYIVLIEYVLFAILLIYTILLKYAYYSPDEKSGAMQFFTMLGIISIFIPFLILVIIVLSIKFLFQAINNLNNYLNDYN